METETTPLARAGVQDRGKRRRRHREPLGRRNEAHSQKVLRRDESSATAIEYGLIAAGISLAVIAAATLSVVT